MMPEHHHHHHHTHHPPPPPSPPSSSTSRGASCCRCRCPAPAFTCLGVCVLVLAYTLLGAFTFMALEGGSLKEVGRSAGLGEEVRARTVEKLWSITEDLNILYKDNWTRLAAQEVLKFQDTLVRSLRGEDTHHRWSFSSSFLYSLTLITTIGYGSVAPRTAWGKLITIVYALIGIPLMLVYLSTVGDVLARNFRRLYGRVCVSHKSKLPLYKAQNNVSSGDVKVLDCISSSTAPLDPGGKRETVRVPISLCLLIILMYICGGALLFNRLENWSFLEGSYFCFTSLGTIGFGDLIPGLLQYHRLSVFASSAYILVGMALIAMCFNLVQDEVVLLVRRLGHYFGVAGGVRECGDEGMAMAVVTSSS